MEDLVAATTDGDDDDVQFASKTIDCLQQVIHRFSDHHDRIPAKEAQQFWQSHDNDNVESPVSSPQKKNLKDIVHRYAPVGLESQFEQLYCLLHPCLVVRENETNAAAFCLGHRGMGKGMLVDRCLQAFQDEIKYSSYNTTATTTSSSSPPQQQRCSMFRLVHVHGVLVPGNCVSLVVRDMLQQLSQTAFDEDDNTSTTSPQSSIKEDSLLLLESPLPLSQMDKENNDNTPNNTVKRPKTTRRVENFLRLRRSTFDSNLQLLGETLQIARVDQIPILVVLDEVDAFMGGSGGTDGTNNNNNSNNQMDSIMAGAGRERQLLLYHLLDRVATQGSNICLIGLTQHLALRSKLEKRIKSRMEGTSKEIFVGHCASITTLVSVLLSHIVSNTTTALEEIKDQQDPLVQLYQQVSRILTPPSSAQEKHNDNHSNPLQKLVWATLEREYRMGRNIRWFSRIFTFALALYRGEWIKYHRAMIKAKTSTCHNNNAKPPTFDASHLLDALVAQGASIRNLPHGKEVSHQQNNNNSRKRDSSLVIMSGNDNAPPMAVDPRIQALLDMSPPQVALMLAARRILSRDAQWNGETASPPPLTLGRMLQEYSNFRSNQQRFSRHLFWIAFQELLEMNLIRPAADHCGTGPFQYEHQIQNYSSVSEAEDVPLHLLVDINRELTEALQSNLLECPTALREWGRKTNT